MTGARPGTTLVELILVAWLFAFVLLGLSRYATAQGTLGRLAADRVRAGELARSAHLVLSREIRYLAPADVAIPEPDLIRLRAVRGSGTVCHGSGRSLVVDYRGVRLPEPSKDSVLVVSSGALTHAYGLDGARSDGGCGNGLVLELSEEPGAYAGLVMVFEPGEYHLASGALRYRRGRGGRQPLTEALLEGGSMQPLTFTSGGMQVVFSLHRDSIRNPARRDIRLQIHQPGATPAAGIGPGARP